MTTPPTFILSKMEEKEKIIKYVIFSS